MARSRPRCAVLFAVVCTLVAGAPACTADGADAADPGSTLARRDSEEAEVVGSLRWAPCDDDILRGLQCTSLAVPLDPDQPDGTTIDLALSRRPANHDDERVGSIVVNPGGPGASGVELVTQLGTVVDDAVLDRFDLVGFDPRGVGRSAPVRCIDDLTAVGSLDGDPDDQSELDALVEAQAATVQRCVERHAELLPHLSTADAAHDLDRIREAVGDPRLTYLGFSYGTQLGATYATLFPDHIRALVLDGAVGPDLSGDELALAQAQGFELAFQNFIDACRTDERCAVRPDARAAYEAVRARVEAAPVPVSTEGDDRTLGPGDFQTGVVSALYDQALWAYLARGLQEAADGDGATLLALADLYRQRKPDGTYPNSADANIAISCADSSERATVAGAKAAAARFAAIAPTFGALLGWMDLACVGWPAAADPPPPVATVTTAPILVIGTVNDPATPYEWAEQLTTALGPTARLLTYEGEGHTAYLKSDCITDAVDAFLVELTPPPAGTRCPVEDDGDGAFAGIGPELRDAFIENSGLTEEQATCVSSKVAATVTAVELVALYAGELPPTMEAAITDAALACAKGD